jgi:outer membrane lipoprotein-sorting protein
MKRLLLVLLFVICHLSFCLAQPSAKSVLDKCAAVVSNKNGIQASFSMESAQFNNIRGTIAVKGRKFHAQTGVAAMWFDGKTQWTYLKKNDEVSVTSPTDSQLQALNPYNFINMYKKGFKYTMTTTAGSYQVHLTATDPKRKVQEMFITVDQKSYHPTQVKLLQDSRWTVFNITDLKKATLADGEFRFNSKDYPTAEVIDLR